MDRRKVSSVIKLPTEEIKEIFIGIARLRNNRGWELLLSTDHTFIDKYPDVVQRQQLFWEAKQKQFSDLVSESKQSKPRRKSKSVSEEVKLNGVKRDRSLATDSDVDKLLPAVKKLKSAAKTDMKTNADHLQA